MKKQFLNLGKALNKAEQKSINGGHEPYDNGEHQELCCEVFNLGGYIMGGCEVHVPFC